MDYEETAIQQRENERQKAAQKAAEVNRLTTAAATSSDGKDMTVLNSLTWAKNAPKPAAKVPVPNEEENLARLAANVPSGATVEKPALSQEEVRVGEWERSEATNGRRAFRTPPFLTSKAQPPLCGSLRSS